MTAIDAAPNVRQLSARQFCDGNGTCKPGRRCVHTAHAISHALWPPHTACDRTARFSRDIECADQKRFVELSTGASECESALKE